MVEFPTPRLLLEVRRESGWEATEIYCEYKTARDLISKFPRLANVYGVAISSLRVKNLRTDEAIYQAKRAVTDTEAKRRREKRGDK